jgi:dynactin-4
LLTRATNIQVPSTEDPSKLVPKKMFYLVCGFCRWTTREAGLPDQPSGSFIFKEMYDF